MSSQNTVSNKRKQTSPQRTPELVSKRRRTGGVDSLELLRKYVSRKIPITREGNHLHFGNRKFHIKTPTRIKKKDSGQHYDLGTVWFLVCGGVSLSEYLKGAKQGGVDTINFADREAVKNYITGELETIPQLDTAAPAPIVQPAGAYADKQQEPGTTVTTRSSTHDAAWRRYEDVVKREVVLQDRCSLLTVANKDFKRLIYDLGRREKQKELSAPSRARKVPRISLGPVIIVVPATFSSCINMYNAQDFFEKGVYTSPQNARKKTPTKPESFVFTHRTSTGKKIDFKVIDAAETLSLSQYENIGATIMQGPEWQFADWHWKNPAKIFNQSCGFYFHKDQVPPHKNTSKWNVEIMVVHTHAAGARKKRLDTLLRRKFWVRVEDFLRKKMH